MITAVFVYGTLKRGQCRSGLWPAQPLSVQAAWTRGTLFERSDYPAMTAGEDRVLGELWCFDGADITRVLETLDQIEGTNQPGQGDLYVRSEVDTWDLTDQPLESANVYHYATDPTSDGFTRLEPSDDAFARWPAEPK
jgi:gamma-glutamylcyclotransferase (GGCT)/AIG2-like uncharacterized protein YtfP